MESCIEESVLCDSEENLHNDSITFVNGTSFGRMTALLQPDASEGGHNEKEDENGKTMMLMIAMQVRGS